MATLYNSEKYDSNGNPQGMSLPVGASGKEVFEQATANNDVWYVTPVRPGTTIEALYIAGTGTHKVDLIHVDKDGNSTTVALRAEAVLTATAQVYLLGTRVPECDYADIVLTTGATGNGTPKVAVEMWG